MELKTEVPLNSAYGGEVELSQESRELLATLPAHRFWDGTYLFQYHGFWFRPTVLQGVVSFQKLFEAHDTDVFLSSIPKSGTTWLKALLFAIVNRDLHPPNQSPLLTTNPHDLVRFLEWDLYYLMKSEAPNLQDLPSPRILSTHVPYSLLPASIKDSQCRIVYLCRNPLDRFISFWHFVNTVPNPSSEPGSVEDGLEEMCRDIEVYGPFWDHVLEYWKISKERPEKVLFLKYEDLREDVIAQIKKIADFLGVPFSEEEERRGLIEEISKLCSFRSLKALEVNKSGHRPGTKMQNSAYFRKGEVGDWVNHVSPCTTARITALMEEKLRGSGLSFKLQTTKIEEDNSGR